VLVEYVLARIGLL